MQLATNALLGKAEAGIPLLPFFDCELRLWRSTAGQSVVHCGCAALADGVYR